MAREVKFKGQILSEDLLKQKAESMGITVEKYLEDYKDEFEITEEIQTTPTEGKTNGAAAKGATATPETGPAPESTELEPDDILSGLEEIKDVREIDKRIDKITSTKATKFFEEGEISPLDSPKRIAQYKELINRRNNIIGDTYKLGQTQQYQQLDFDPMSPAKIPLEKEGAPEGGVKLAYVPFTVDGKTVGTTMEPVGLKEVVITAEQYKERENQIQSEAYKEFLEQSGLSTEPLSREEFEAERLKLGTITDASEPEYTGLDPIQAFENIGTMLSSFQQTAQEKENYRSQYENYLKKLGNLDPNVKRKLPGFLESTLGSTANMFLQIGGVDDRALYNLSFIMSNVPDDVYANVFGKDLGADLKKEAIKGFSNIDKKINDLNSLTSDTVGFTDLPDAEGVLGKTSALVGGSYNAITSFAASYVTNISTAGVGLASDMIANSVKDFNDKKAQSLGLTTEELIASGQSEVLTPGFLGMLGYSLEKAGLDKVGSIISTGLKQGAAKSIVSLLTAGGAEGTTEYLQGLVETYNLALGQGLSTKDALEKVKKELTSKESLERVLQGAVGGSGIVLGSQGLKAVSALRSPAENKKLTQIINQLNELENSKFRKNLTADEIGEINTAQEELRFNLKNIVDNNNELISTLTKQQVETLNINADFLTTSASKINEIQNSEAYTEQDKEVLISAVNQQRELASQNIFNIRNEAEKLQSQIEKVKGLTGLVKGLNIEEADTAADAEKFAEDNNLDIKSSTSQGYILQNPETGEQTIVINKETALNEQAVNVAAHEFLHAILFKTVKDSPQTAINLGNALLSELNKIDVDQIKDSNFKKRMEQYNDQSREVKMEEALTLFSDALVTGDISFKENAFTKLGDRVRRVAQKFGVNVKFNTGRDVYNFIKDYNKSIEKGKLSIAQVRAAAKGVEGELVAPVTEQRDDKQIIKASLKAEDSAKVNKIFAEKGTDGSFDILELLRPTAVGLANRFNKRPSSEGSDKQLIEDPQAKQLLVDEIMTGERGMLDIINDYAAKIEKGEKVGPLSGFLNNSFSTKTGFKRYIEAADRILGKEFGESVDNLIGLEDTGTTTTITSTTTKGGFDVVEETETRKAQLPRQTTKFNTDFAENLGIETEGKTEAEINEEVQKQFDKAIAKDLEAIGDVTTFAQTKDIGPALAALMEKATQGRAKKIVNGVEEIVKTPGMPAAVFSDKRKNIAKKDATSGALTALKQFLDANAQRDFNNLPDAFSKDTGKATFIPENVKGALYRKNDKDRFVLDKSKSLSDYRALLGDMEKPVYRASEAQTIKGLIALSLRNRMFEQAMPSAEKRSATGVKFSLSTKQDLDWKITDEDIQTTFKVKGKEYTTRLEETAFMEFDEGQTYTDIDNIAKRLGIQEDSEGDDISSSEKFYHLEFADEAGDTGITGAGNAAEVFSVNINGVVDYLKDNPDVEGVIFTAKEPSRIRLYERLSEVMADKIGGQFGFENDTFIVTNQRPKAKIKPKAVVKFSKQGLLDVKSVAEGSIKSIVPNLLPNFTVKQLKDMGVETVADAKRLLGLPAMPARGSMKADADRPITKSGYKGLKGQVQATAKSISEFLNDYPQYWDIIRRSTTNSLSRSSMGSARLYDALVPRPKGQFDKAENRKIYKGKDRTLIDKVAKEMTTPAFVEDQLKRFDYLEQYYLDVQEYLSKEPNEQARINKAWVFGQMLDDAQNDMGSLNRISAPILIVAVNKNGKIDVKSIIREEHNFPQNQVGNILLDAAIKGDVENAMKIIRATYMQGAVLMSDDVMLDKNFKTKMPKVFWDKIVPRILDGSLQVDPGVASAIRLGMAGVDLDGYKYLPTNQNFSEYLFGSKGLPQPQQAELIYKYLTGENTLDDIRRIGKALATEYKKLSSEKIKASKSNNEKLLPSIRLEDPSTFDKFGMVDTVAKQMFPKETSSDAVKSGRITPYEALDPDQQLKVLFEVPGTPVENTIAVMSTTDEAIRFSRNADAPNKGISIWDFDDTLATTKSNVLYTMPDGTEGTLTAEQFAKRGEDLLQEGAEFDFSEFEKVTKGAKGPMFEKAVARNRKFGNDNVFILTARTQSAAKPIHQFLKAIGLDIPLNNIVGLGNSTPEAKARWVVGKAAEGYNDFYFADDAYKNVKAVQDALSVLDVKSKTRQAYVKFSKASALDKGFNDILEQTTGIASEKEYKRVKAEVAGASRGMAIRGIPYSAQDFVGLLYETLGKGDLGDRQMAWYKTHVLNPYARAMNDIDNARLAMMNDYKSLKKQLGLVPKNLRKKIPGEPFTNEQAVRVYIWNKQGMEVPGISKSDLKDLTEHVENNAELQVFADQLIAIQKGDEYAKPKQGWPAGSITTDLLESINTTKRAKYLEQWQENVDVIFSEKNMNKLEAAYGKKYRVALENMLERMKTGRNRRFSDDSLTGRFTDWLQGSIGTIMFFNTRSALLQTISAMNFINFTDNNPLAAAKAFGNQKQFWSDFVTLINSDFLKARRSGLRMNVNEADIADMAKKGGPRAVINKLLQLGFAPTQIADSFAIASGGATFYRNRINTYKKQGLSQQEAEAKAFEDFRENAEESQQSARPDRISMQQAGGLGRLILAFQNTPSQYARIIDKSIRDLKNGRGDAKTNISKIIYYSTVQNLLFNALQQALFAFAFGDEEPEDEEKQKKYVDIANSMMDSLLRGTGIAGGILSVGKNAILRIARESEKARPNYEKVGADLLKIAPPVSSKLSKINQAARSYKWDKEEMKQKGWSLDNPAYLAGANVISALTNVPLDRGIKKANNVVNATDSDLETWERLALLGGWQDWEIGVDEEKPANKPQPRKSTINKKRKPSKR